MIVFGWNSFMLEEHKPSTLGMPADLDQQIKFEKRQKYFHLFWIPFFGIGTTWVVRKPNDSQMYEPPADLRALLEALPAKSGTPWYTFALPILAAAGCVIFFVGSSISSYQSKKRHEEYMAKKTQQEKNAIVNPAQGTYFKMYDRDDSKPVYLKVLSHSNASLLCLFSEKQGGYSSDEVLEAFTTDETNAFFDTVQIDKNKMLMTIDSTGSYNFDGFEVLTGAGNYSLQEMKEIQFPVFKNLASEYQDGKFVAILQNIGETARFKGYVAENANMQIDSLSFPAEIKSGEVIVLKGSYEEMEPRLRGKLTFESLSNKTAEFSLNISGTYLSFKQNNK